jgi:hypothetical protein
MKEENKKKWDQAIGTLIPEPCIVGLVSKDRRPINRKFDSSGCIAACREATNNFLDPRIKREVEPLTQNLGSAFEEVGL